MARPSKAGMEYFPFDVTFFSDRKIKVLRSRFGPDGPLFYLYILCEVYRDKGYYLATDVNFQDVTAVDLGVSYEKIGLMLNFMLNQSLLDSRLFNSDKVLTSHGIQLRYQEMVKGRAIKNPVSVDEKLWLLSDEETQSFIRVRRNDSFSGNNADNSKKNSPDSEINAIKKRKGKESKGNTAAAARVRELSEYWQSLGGTSTLLVHDDLGHFLQAGIEPEAIREAMKESALAGAVRGWRYAKRILERYESEGLRTLAQVRAQNQRRRKQDGTADAAPTGRKLGTHV